MSELALNGDWKVMWDPENKGVANRWFTEIPQKAKSAEVPLLWSEAPAASAFYYRKFAAGTKDKRFMLKFGQISVYAVIWVNGKLVSDHFSASTSFALDISPFIRIKGDNLICVKVSNISEQGDFNLISIAEPVLARQMPIDAAWWVKPFAGILGNVSLVYGDKALITSLEISTDPDKERAIFSISFCNPRNYSASLKIFARNERKEVSLIQKDIKLEKENANAILTFRFKDMAMWSVDSPTVYSAEVQLEGSNSMSANFGFRKFDCKRGDFLLNDCVIKIRGIVYSQHANAGPRSCNIEAAKSDLEKIKALGFNAVRTGGTPFSSAVLDICDKLGLLVFQEFPVCNAQSGKMALEAVKALAPEIVSESVSHPSLAAWVLGQENGRLILENGAKLLSHIDSLESFHPAISNIDNVSIDCDQNFRHGHEKTFGTTGKVMGVTDPGIMGYSSHRLSLRMFGGAMFTMFLARYGMLEEDDFIIPDPLFGDAWLQDNYKVFASEIRKNGHVLLTVKNHCLFSAKSNPAMQALLPKIKKFIDKEAKGVWANADAFIKNSNELAMKGLAQNLRALQSSPVTSGYFIEQWADCGSDLSGLADENRTVKNLDGAIKAINSPAKLLLSGLERVVAEGEPISFELSMLNEGRLADVNVYAQIFDNGGKEESAQSKNFPLPKLALAALGDFSVKAPGKPGSYRLRLSLSNCGKEIHSIEEPIEVIKSPDMKRALAKSEFLDAAENSSEIMKMITGKKPVLFTAALSSWADSSILESVAEAVRGGKTLFISDIIPEDLKILNASSLSCSLECIYSSGAGGTSMHYIPIDSPIASEFFGKHVLDETCSAIMPGLSMSAIKGAACLLNSVGIKNGSLQKGTNLQIAQLGEGKLILSTLNFDGLETYALANSVFAKTIELATA